MENKFESSRLFQLWIYSVGHSRLILRSSNNEDEECLGFNIDIEFWGVEYIQLSPNLNGVEIRKITENIPKWIRRVVNDFDSSVFELTSENEVFYIVAYGGRVGQNNWRDSDRILSPELEYDRILATL